MCGLGEAFTVEVKALLRQGSLVEENVPKEVSAEAHAHLDDILRSEAFCNSRQSEKLLRYLVQQSLDGRDELLREKQVGAAVFGRQPDYDTATDSIVRVRVNELRKRLALYYESAPALGGICLRIPRGSYKVEFVRSEAPVMAVAALLPEAAPVRNWRLRLLISALALLVGIATAAGIYGLRGQRNGLEKFWAPALESRAPVILCVGNPVLLRLSKRFEKRLKPAANEGLLHQTMVPEIPREMAIAADDLVAIQNQYVGLGSAYAIGKISSWLSQNHKETEIRFASDLSYTELKRSAAVFIGAFQNRWTLEAMKDQRFVFDLEGGALVVRDQKAGHIWRLPGLKEDGGTNEDYVIITRKPNSDSGQFVVTAAGITQYGCQTAADVLTNSEFLPQLLNRLNREWQRKNAQVLLHVPVIGQTPGVPTVVAAEVW